MRDLVKMMLGGLFLFASSVYAHDEDEEEEVMSLGWDGVVSWVCHNIGNTESRR